MARNARCKHKNNILEIIAYALWLTSLITSYPKNMHSHTVKKKSKELRLKPSTGGLGFCHYLNKI